MVVAMIRVLEIPVNDTIHILIKTSTLCHFIDGLLFEFIFHFHLVYFPHFFDLYSCKFIQLSCLYLIVDIII